MKKKEDEFATTADVSALDTGTAEKPKKGLKQKINDVVSLADTVNNVGGVVTEFYADWIKPIYDNRAQIRRRLNAISTAVSVIFFLLYVPFLLFSKVADGLSLGWETALYVCVGVYAGTLVILLAVNFASRSVTSTETAKRRKSASKVILFFVRIASVAMGITAIAISSGESSPLNVVALIFAIVSLIFAVFPLVTGSTIGFIRWLISPAKIKRSFSFVLLEWYQITISDGKTKEDKAAKKSVKRYIEEIRAIIDGVYLPRLGKRSVRSVDTEDVMETLAELSDESRLLGEWIFFSMFAYAEKCGYVGENPVADMELLDDLGKLHVEKKKQSKEPKSSKNVFVRLFSRKSEKTTVPDATVPDDTATEELSPSEDEND